MRLAYFDAGSGVSGDMILGALVDAGLGIDGLRQQLSGLDVQDYELSAAETSRSGLRACKVDVKVHSEHVHARRIGDILAVIERSALAPRVKEQATRIFLRLGEAEAAAHGSSIEEIHLHEAGATDALVDVVGSVAGLAALGVDRIDFSPLRLGYGTIECAHGYLPVPAPAVAELVKGIPVYAGEIEGEMVTPTGAAIATTLATSFRSMPPMIIRSLGIGAGTADRILPNVLRLFVGEAVEAPREETVEELVVLESNIDDMNPEFFEHLCGRLWALGALDVWLTPIIMKKGRPGTIVSVLAETGKAPGLRETLFRESTTLGVRSLPVIRHALARETFQVQVGTERINIKAGRLNGRIIQVAPEYQDCRSAAEILGRPLKEVYLEAQAKAEFAGIMDKTAGEGDSSGKRA